MEFLLAAGPSAINPKAMITAPTDFKDWLVVLPVIIPLMFGAFTVFFRHMKHTSRYLAYSGVGLTVASCLLLFMHVQENGAQSLTMSRWLPPFGISFTADMIGALFALFGAITAGLCLLYAPAEVTKNDRRFHFYSMFQLMLAGVMGAFLTGDIFNLYVWFEVFLISSFGLIVLGGRARQLDGAVKYAVLNLIATTLFLIATGYLYGQLGTLNMADIARKLPAQNFSGPMLAIAGLYCLAFGMKAAAFPGIFWLPASYHTPKFVVSALFAGLLTKVGIYAIWRTGYTILPGTKSSILMACFYWSGVITTIVGAVGALAQSDFRRMLGYFLISGIGIMLLAASLQSKEALSLACFYAIHSMIAMTGLYLLASLLVDKTHSFSIKYMSGLYQSAPVLAILFFILGFGVAGLPPFSGFWPKFGLIKLLSDQYLTAGLIAVVLNGFLALMTVGRAFGFVFWRAKVTLPKDDNVIYEHGLPLHLAHNKWANQAYLAPMIAATFVLGVGLFPQSLYDLTQAAAQSLLETQSYIDAVFKPIIKE